MSHTMPGTPRNLNCEQNPIKEYWDFFSYKECCFGKHPILPIGPYHLVGFLSPLCHVDLLSKWLAGNWDTNELSHYQPLASRRPGPLKLALSESSWGVITQWWLASSLGPTSIRSTTTTVPKSLSILLPHLSHSC